MFGRVARGGFGIAFAFAAVGLAGAPAQAGFWDSLFGTRPLPPPAAIPGFDSDPLNVTVKGRLKQPKTPRQAMVEDAPVKKSFPMDYKSDPHWYLRDSTLAKGDIVVLDNRVVVYDGGSRGVASFQPFEQSRLISDRARKSLRYLVSAPKDRSVVWEPKAVDGRDGETTARLDTVSR